MSRSFSRAELESFRDAEVPDLLGGPDDPPVRLLFVGINPGLVSAATGMHFARPGNRFYPALQRAGLLTADAVTPELAAPQLLARGVGITNIVARASARADELDDAELLEGRVRLEQLVEARRPRVVAFAGITSYRIAYGEKKARPGQQERILSGAAVWVVPNPSGLNAHETVPSLADAYRAAAVAAGVV